MENDLVKISENELSKVKDNLLNVQQLNILLSETPKNHIYNRPAKGGGTWNYVTGVYVKKVLNLMFGWDWDFEVVEYKEDIVYKQAWVLGKLIVRSNGKSIVKMQFGRADIKFKSGTDYPLDIGNDLKAATTDALKKCASELGIASDVYAPNEFKTINVVEKTIDVPNETINEVDVKLATCSTSKSVQKLYQKYQKYHHIADFNDKFIKRGKELSDA